MNKIKFSFLFASCLFTLAFFIIFGYLRSNSFRATGVENCIIAPLVLTIVTSFFAILKETGKTRVLAILILVLNLILFSWVYSLFFGPSWM